MAAKTTIQRAIAAWHDEVLKSGNPHSNDSSPIGNNKSEHRNLIYVVGKRRSEPRKWHNYGC